MSTVYYDDGIITTLSGQQTAKYCNGGGFAILIFDYFLTLSCEKKYVWGRKWDKIRLIFTVARYLPFVASTMTCYEAIKNSEGQGCLTFNIISYVLHAVSIIFAEALLLLRTYALWERNRKVLIGLLVLAVIFFTTALVLAMTVNFGEPPDSSSTFAVAPSGCEFQVSRGSAFQYVFPMLYEIVLQGMNSFKNFRDYRNVKSSVLKSLYWDGMWYMLCIILVSAMNITLLIAAPIAYSDAMETFQLVTHSVLASRIFFNLREANEHARNTETYSSVPLTTFSAEGQSQEHD